MLKQVRLFRASMAAAAIAAVSLIPVVGHVDDPKERDRQPPYVGPGWCSTGCGGDEGGLAGGPPLNFPSSGVRLLSWLPLGQFGAFSSGNDCWGYVSPAGREYALMGLSGGTGFVDITDPGSPVIVSVKTGPTSTWRDIKVYQHYVYSVSEGGSGIQVFDVANIDSGVVTLVNTISNDATASTHNVALNESSGYLYRCGGGSNVGLRIYSLANPAVPTWVATWSNRYVHDAQIVNYTSGPYAGKEIAFCCAGLNNGGTNTGLTILDVTNKAAIVELAHYQYPSGSYSHQGWLSQDRHYFYLDDELDEQNNPGIFTRSHVIDVSNLSAPVQVGTFTTGVGAIDHNMYVKGNMIFQANYRSGLRVFDATNPLAPVQVAYFDTYPTDDNANFNGMWSNYPFFPSGTIIGSDIEKGLFVFQLGNDLIDISYPNGQPALLNPAGASVDVTIANVDGAVDPATAKLAYAVNGGAFTEVPLQQLGGSAFRANFPPIACGSAVRWYVVTKTTSGVTVRDPVGAPNNAYDAQAAIGMTAGPEDTLETNTGWVVGNVGDDATTGIWIRADPVGTAAQPEDDHTPAPGVNCYITGNGTAGGALGDNDIDGGTTTLTSPNFDATAGSEARIVYHRWYSNNTGSAPGEDSMPVLISNNGGSTWTQLELVTENTGAWVKKSFRIADFVTPTNQIKLRFLARDLLNGSIVEAGVDDVRVEYLQCGVPGDITGDGLVNVADLLAVITAWGPCPAPPTACPADIVTDGMVNVADLLFVITHWG